MVKFLAGTYTADVKSYCDEVFFKYFNEIPCDKIVVNNGTKEYNERLSSLVKCDIVFLDSEADFMQVVADSANLIRDIFLNGDYDFLLTLESDVLPKCNNLLELFEVAVETICNENLGMIGGLYYENCPTPHDLSRAGEDELVRVTHVLSGCAIYSRKILQRFPFKIDKKLHSGAFPDAWMAYDARNNGFLQYNYHKIVCNHLAGKDGKRH